MNSVHEPGSRTMSKKFDSGTILSQIGLKTGRVHRVHSLLAQQHARPRSQCPCRAPVSGACCAPAARALRAVAACPACLSLLPLACPVRAPIPLACLRVPAQCPRACCEPQRLPAPCRGPVTILQYNPCPASVTIHYSVSRHTSSSSQPLLQYSLYLAIQLPSFPKPLLACNPILFIAIYF